MLELADQLAWIANFVLNLQANWLAPAHRDVRHVRKFNDGDSGDETSIGRFVDNGLLARPHGRAVLRDLARANLIEL